MLNEEYKEINTRPEKTSGTPKLRPYRQNERSMRDSINTIMSKSNESRKEIKKVVEEVMRQNKGITQRELCRLMNSMGHGSGRSNVIGDAYMSAKRKGL